MSEPAFTPGPWIADDFCEENDQCTRVGTYDGTPTYYHRTTTIAYCQTNFGDDLDDNGPEIGIVTAEANARLVAAAPDLYRAMELARRLATQVRNDLASAHAEICKLQGIDPARHSWPDWSPQANTLRWLMKHDVEFFGPMPEPPHSKPRRHNGLPKSRAYTHRPAWRQAGNTITNVQNNDK